MGQNYSQCFIVISYYPYSTIKKSPFIMIYVTDVVLLVEIDTLTLRHTQFNKDENEA